MIRRFGAARSAVANPEVVPRDPLGDVILTGSAIYLAAEMTGVTGDDVRVGLDLGQLTIHAEGERRYQSLIDLPADVDPDTLKHKFKNGGLDIVIARRPSPV